MTPAQRRAKLVAQSSLLGREFHADLFAREGATVLIVMFGGSGVGEAEYVRRRETVAGVFDRALDGLEPSLRYAFVYVTAPYDLPFARFSTDDRARTLWNSHVENELISAIDTIDPRIGALPRYLIGYSGGAALALSGHHESGVTVGAGMIGGTASTRQSGGRRTGEIRSRSTTTRTTPFARHQPMLSRSLWLTSTQ